MGPALERMREEALPRTAEACTVVPAKLGERLGDLAALCAAIAANGGIEALQANGQGMDGSVTECVLTRTAAYE